MILADSWHRLLPSGCALVVKRVPRASEPIDRVFDEEAQLVQAAVHKRRAEFAAGRVCARAALVAIGRGAAPVLAGPHGEPWWPPGVVGSISHSNHVAAAAVADRAAGLAGLGIDVERWAPLPPHIVGSITGGGERSHLRLLDSRRPDVPWSRVLFSAKESVFKVWYPLAGDWLDFCDAKLSFTVGPDDHTGGFLATLRRPLAVEGRVVSELVGGWARDGDHVLTQSHVRH